jgi:septal ring factor EnvC (AmiA/AmiB activator)
MKKYDNLWKDIDCTQRELELVKRNNSDESQRAADQLDKQLKNQYRDIKELEYEIKDLDSALKSS